MKHWFAEDYAFTVTVLSVKPDNTPEKHCRNGLEPGDRFTCAYGCPGGLCQKSMLKLFPLMEAVRSGGDLRNLGGSGEHAMELDCPDGVVRFRLEAVRIPAIRRSMQAVTAENREAVNAYIREHWFSTDMLLRGEVVDLTKADGYVLTDGAGAIAGLVTYLFREDFCEIASLNAEIPDRGIGTLLIEQAVKAAREAGCKRVKLLTTNDNIHAIRFYQRRGFDLLCVNHGAIDRERLLKPEIPLTGEEGIPLRHEVELALEL